MHAPVAYFPAGHAAHVRPAGERERRNRPLLEHVYQLLNLRARETFLDVGCGSGYLAAMALERGAYVAGVDPNTNAVSSAKRRLPQGDFHAVRFASLPFANSMFDAAACVNALVRAEQPLLVLRELRRVMKGSGRAVIANWGDPERCQSATCFDRIRTPNEVVRAGAPGLHAFAVPATLDYALGRGAFALTAMAEFECVHEYPDLEAATHGLVGAGHAPRSVRALGTQQLPELMQALLAPYRTPAGSFRLRDTFLVAVVRPAGAR
jgi:SAM-dependent methyltransferase